MSSNDSCEQSVSSSTEATSTSAPDSSSLCTSLVLSPTSTHELTTDLEISLPAFEDALRSFQGLGAEIARLQIENTRLVEHNTAIEKELEILNEQHTAVEKELETLKEENVKLSEAKDEVTKKLAEVEEEKAGMQKELDGLGELKEENINLSEAKDDAMKKLAEVEEEKAGLQKELDGLGELKEVMGWKKRCEELENRVTENQEKMEKLFEDYQQQMEKRATENQEKIEKSFEDYQQEMEKRATENHERMEKLFEDYQQQMVKRIADVQHPSQENLEQEIALIKADNILHMENLVSAIEGMCLESMKDGYIFSEKPFKIIPRGMIRVSRARVTGIDSHAINAHPREDKDTRFLYVMRDQYRNFKKFTQLAESVFGLPKGYIKYLKATKSDYQSYGTDRANLIIRWEQEASMKDRIYISSDSHIGIVYYVDR
ncbi:hypothetical protein BZA77DRAFT_31168 [Pyronema omphalodes]|nr:hypothetical protein BZA77DRAFT_31168 [Pyronema omphalodes]